MTHGGGGGGGGANWFGSWGSSMLSQIFFPDCFKVVLFSCRLIFFQEDFQCGRVIGTRRCSGEIYHQDHYPNLFKEQQRIFHVQSLIDRASHIHTPDH